MQIKNNNCLGKVIVNVKTCTIIVRTQDPNGLTSLQKNILNINQNVFQNRQI